MKFCKLLIVTSMLVSGGLQAATATFSWTSDGIYWGTTPFYNELEHQYSEAYARPPEATTGIFDACDSDVSDFSSPAYKWEIAQRPLTVLRSGSWSVFWISEWVPACILMLTLSDVSVGAVTSPSDLPATLPGLSNPALAGPGFDLAGQSSAFEDDPARDDPMTEIVGVSRTRFGGPIISGSISNADGGGVPGDGGTPPTDMGPAAPNSILLGPALPDGDYSVTLRIRDEDSGNEVQVNDLISVKSLVVALLGDSFASGEGNPDNPGQVEPVGPLDRCQATTAMAALFIEDDRGDLPYDPVHETDDGKKYGLPMLNAPAWLDLAANRSHRSGHALAVEEVGYRLYAETRGWTIRFFNFATSGAKTKNVLSEPQMFFQRVGDLGVNGSCGPCSQLDELAATIGDQRIDALILSVGGNDVGFSDYLRQATEDLLSNQDIEAPFIGVRPSDEPEFLKKLEQLHDSYSKLDKKIKSSFSDVGTIILTGYPTDIFSAANGGTDEGCGIFEIEVIPTYSGVQQSEAIVLRKWGGLLRDLQICVADELGWTFVDVSEDFIGHGYCTGQPPPDLIAECGTGDATYFRSAEKSCVIQGNIQGTMHPNKCGHQVYKRRLLPVLSEALIPNYIAAEKTDSTSCNRGILKALRPSQRAIGTIMASVNYFLL